MYSFSSLSFFSLSYFSLLYSNLHLYFILCFILIFLTFFIYVKLYFPFWNLQPVKHPYDMFRFWIQKPTFVFKPGQAIMGAISDSRKRNRFCDFSLVSLLNVSDITESDVQHVCLFLQSHFIRGSSETDTLFLFYPQHFLAYHSDPSAICSFIRSPIEPIFDSFVSSRPIHLSFLNDSSSRADFSVSFVDFLCVRDPSDLMSLRKLLQTHFLRSCFVDSSPACIFRKEDEPALGIVPFLQFSSDVYSLKNFTRISESLPANMRLTFLKPSLYDLQQSWSDVILPQLNSIFKMVGVCSVESLCALIRARILFIGVLMEVTTGEDIVYAVYVFRDSRTVYSIAGEEGALLQLVCSVHWCDDSLFSFGFLYCLRELLNQTKNIFQCIMAEDIAHNSLLLPLFTGIHMDTHQMYYYSYNMLIPDLQGSSCFFLF
jgi:hypothetical protein